MIEELKAVLKDDRVRQEIKEAKTQDEERPRVAVRRKGTLSDVEPEGLIANR